MTLAGDVERALGVLAGVPWRGVGQAAGMGVLDFGDEVEVRSAVHGSLLRARYSLHVQCPFRVTGKNSLLVGSADLDLPGGRGGHDNRYDFLTAELDARLATDPLIVRQVKAGEFGDLQFRLDHGIGIDVFVAGDRGESWRLVVRPDAPHHVLENGVFGSVPSEAAGTD